MIEVPAYIVDELREHDAVRLASRTPADLLIDAADGLRVINEVEQLAAFEYAACQTSNGVRRLLIRGLEPGMREDGGRRACSSGTGRRCRAT